MTECDFPHVYDVKTDQCLEGCPRGTFLLPQNKKVGNCEQCIDNCDFCIGSSTSDCLEWVGKNERPLNTETECCVDIQLSGLLWNGKYKATYSDKHLVNYYQSGSRYAIWFDTTNFIWLAGYLHDFEDNKDRGFAKSMPAFKTCPEGLTWLIPKDGKWIQNNEIAAICTNTSIYYDFTDPIQIDTTSPSNQSLWCNRIDLPFIGSTQNSKKKEKKAINRLY